MTYNTFDLDYREIIRSEFSKRREKNPFYSLRKYAKDLGLSPMHLSYLFKNKRGLSKESALHVGKILGYNNHALKKFCLVVAMESGRSRYEKNMAYAFLQKKWIQEAKI